MGICKCNERDFKRPLAYDEEKIGRNIEPKYENISKPRGVRPYLMREKIKIAM